MPAPDRSPPFNTSQLAINPLKGIVGHYSADEVDALLAGLSSGGDSAIAVHEGPVPQPAAPIPQALEDAFADYADGLHYFKDAGSLVSVTRQQYQTTIVISGAGKSVAKIVKSDAGLPTPQNPSLLVQQEADGKWMKLTSDKLDQPFGPPQMVDIFSLNGSDPATVDLSGYYTKPEVDAAIASAATGGTVDLSSYALLDSYSQVINANRVKADSFVFSKSDTIIGYARFPDYPEGKLGIEIGGAGGKVEFIAYESSLANYATKKSVDLLGGAVDAVIGGNYTKEESDAKFAKQSDSTQNIVVNGMVAKGYTFGDTISGSNPGLAYTDTNQGYGERLVLDTPNGVEYVIYASDLAAVKSRVEALEGKQAPASDLSQYITLIDADARYGSHEAVKLLQGQLQDIFSSLYTRAESDARYAQKSDLAPYITTTQVNTVMGAFATRAYVDQKFTSVNPAGAVTLNDPGMADFKQSVLDEVKKLMAGGKTVPADIDWTVCPSVAGSGTIEARVLNGVIQLRGEVTISVTATGSFTLVRRLPANFPKPLAEYHSLVYGIQVGSTYRRVFVRWLTNGDILICPDGAMTAATLTGATAYAY